MFRKALDLVKALCEPPMIFTRFVPRGDAKTDAKALSSCVFATPSR
jgi:hypothetical protein